MTPCDVQHLLHSLLEEVMAARDDEDALADLVDQTSFIRGIQSFDDAGILTLDKGLVIECEDGTEFQLTIVRSK